MKIEHITKVEGHGRLYVDIKKNEVKKVEMQIFEGARYFEGLVKGRDYTEIGSITSRICGICSQSHLLAGILAIEDALKVKVTEQTKKLRELMMLGSLLQSHILHLYFLALPDYLGFDNAISMASKHKKEVKRGLTLKKFANDIVTLTGGREIHSLTAIVGGFTKIPKKEDFKALQKRLLELKKDFEETAKLFGKLKYPKFERETKYLAIRDGNKINYLEGMLITSDKEKIKTKDYQKHIKEIVETYSNSKTTTIKKGEYAVGALARLNINKNLISKNAKAFLKKSKLNFKNPYHNNFAQAIEVLDFFDKIKSILTNLSLKDEEPKKIKLKAGRGVAIVEAPRGLLIHDYNLDSKGKVTKANIIAPTTHNLKNMEVDIKKLLPKLLKTTKSEKKLLFEMEKLVRAYDPCISCSTHFLEIEWV